MWAGSYQIPYDAAAAGGNQTVALSPAVLTLSAPAITPGGTGSASVALSPAVLTLSAVAVTPAGSGTATVSLSPAVLTLNAVAITPTGSGTATVALSPAVLTLSAVAVAPSAGGTSVALSPAVLTLSAVALTPSGTGTASVALSPAVLSLSAVAITPAGSGSASVALSPAVLSLVAAAMSPGQYAALDRLTLANARSAPVVVAQARLTARPTIGDFVFFGFGGPPIVGWNFTDSDVDFLALGVEAGMTLRVPSATPTDYPIDYVPPDTATANVIHLDVTGGEPNGGAGGSDAEYYIVELPSVSFVHLTEADARSAPQAEATAHNHPVSEGVAKA